MTMLSVPRATLAFLLVSAIPAAAGTIEASQADNGKTVTVPLHDTLVVHLPGQHDSGRYWRLDADLTPQLVLAGRTTDSVAVTGAPETTTFSFAADAPGSMNFRATYAKPDTPRAANSEISFEVQVSAP